VSAIAAGVGAIAPSDPPREVRTDAGASVDAGAIEPEPNAWIAIAAAPDIVLGVDALGENESAFLRTASVRGPERAYEIQAHEVTWAELEAWRPSVLPDARQTWLPPDAADRARYPATGVPWAIAREYCESFGADLPTEAQWEHAARGSAQRPYAWGDAVADPDRTNLGPYPAPVMTHDQDRSPEGVWDLVGNAREWTVDLWRENESGREEDYVHREGRTFRTVRGLPIVHPSPLRPPEAAPAAYRMSLCATGACPEGAEIVGSDVGFRCARELP
jgi:formylglycine-generating enzyme required for sulfatase activity